jgi:hypothetical protein
VSAVDDPTRMMIPMFRVEPPPVEPPRYAIIHSADVKVGDTVRVLELVDGVYREIEEGWRVIDG